MKNQSCVNFKSSPSKSRAVAIEFLELSEIVFSLSATETQSQHQMPQILHTPKGPSGGK
jgi:hypothetical protein